MDSLTLSLPYVPSEPPRQGRYELSCRRDGEGWTVRGPGVWIARGEEFVPEPAFVDAWLREALKPFGGEDRYAEHHVPTDAQFQAFVKSLEPVLNADLVSVFPDDPLLRLERAKRSADPSADIAAALALREDAQTLLAASYAHTIDHEAAIGFARRALEHEPKHDEAGARLMFLLKAAGRLEEVLAVEAARPTRSWIVRAGLLLQLGQLERAVEAFAQALAEKDQPLIRAQRGTLLEKLGRDDEALRELDLSLPRCAYLDGTLAKANILIRRGELELARQFLEWLALAPSHKAIAEARLRELPQS